MVSPSIKFIYIRNDIVQVNFIPCQEVQKQPPRDVPKRCSENMRQIYSKAPMLKCNFNKVALLCFATLLKSHCGMGALL